MKKTALIAVLAAVLLSTACASSGDAPLDPVGSWGSDVPGEPNLVLEQDGKLSGTDGCNRLIGSWERTGDTLEFGPLGGTRMLCEGVDTWLADAASATLGTDSLQIYNAADQPIGTLDRDR
ncbi:META domain-containing protein [Paeniglutamicibacter gangotriensis]|uniref:META domain protein n=2 Tax=Paeniglutamicibacter gangotriensis TaxID=254787 RepID=M7MQ73_9MICC|nr:META domain-containing protein [Paeniglutamicibacter gangotriensis]EMQ98532.1 META domain protein [Paeniglutamicibacter gangotriensis Lz1y]KAA0975214.1 META domain-containing protein [Paeniglutamicibacter gangotriensis]